MRRITIALALAIAALAACGNVRPSNDDAAQPADAAVDAEIIDTPIDGPDAMPPPIDAPLPSPGQEFTGASGRVGGSTFTMDVQLGHPHGQQQLQGSTYRLEANTPIKP